MIARNASPRRCTRPRFLPFHAAHAASVVEHAAEPESQDYAWDDAPVTARELLVDLVGGALLIGGGLLVVWLVLL